MEMLYRGRLHSHYERRLLEGQRKQEALFDTLRAALSVGDIGYGDRLPATRALAKWYGLSRGSVNLVYDMLAAEGYVQASVGQGTFAAYKPLQVPTAEDDREQHTKAHIRLSSWAHRLSAQRQADQYIEEQHPIHLDLSIGWVDPSSFPADAWKHAVYKEVRDFVGKQNSDAANPEGSLQLR